MGSRLMNLTQGEAVIYHSFHDYEPYKGSIPQRTNGVMISSENGTGVPYALFQLKDRGPMFIEPGTPVYQGMIVGEHCKDNDISVNICKEKKLTNMRTTAADEMIRLEPPREITLELALEYIEDDELIEMTPAAIRLRKRSLTAVQRRRIARAGGEAAV